MNRTEIAGLVWCLVVVLSIVGVAPGSVAADHHTKDYGGIYNQSTLNNYSVYLYSNPNNPSAPANPHEPGADEVSKWREIIVPRNKAPPNQVAWINYTRAFKFQVSTCTLDNLKFFGVDRGDPQEGDPPDNGTGGPEAQRTGAYAEYESMVSSLNTNAGGEFRGTDGSKAWAHWKEITAPHGGHKTWALATNAEGEPREDYFIEHAEVAYWSPEKAKSEPDRKPFNASNWDRIVVDQTDCYTNPETPGWYRQAGFSEVYDASTGDTPAEAEPTPYSNKTVSFSHWVYICECASYDEAIDELGPPPGLNFSDSSDEAATPTPKPAPGTPTPTATSSTATPRGTVESTPTATEPTRVQSTPTDTPTETTTETVTTTTQAATETTIEDTETTGNSDGDGPGFGIVVAILGLLGAVLLPRLRN